MAGTISQRISLEGAEDIRQKLEALGQAGAKAFDQIRNAASQPISDPAQIDQTKQAIDQLATACASLSESLGTVSGAGETAGEGVAKLGEASQETGGALGEITEQANQATEAVSRFNLENVRTGSEIAKNAAEFAKTGVEIGLLVTRHESLIVSLTKMALGAGVASTGLEVLVGVLGGAVVVIGGVVLGIGAAVAAFGALSAAAMAAAAPYEKLNNTLQTLSDNTGVAFDKLQRGQALFEQLGVSAEGFGNIMTKIAAELNNLDIGAAFKKSADDFKKATNDVLVAEKELLELQIKLDEAGRLTAPINARQRLLELDKEIAGQLTELTAAEEKLADARIRAAEAAANSLAKVLEQIKAIEEGQRGITFDPLTKGETILKALAISMKEAADQGKAASTVLLQFIVNVDRLNALSAGAKFGLSEADVDRIRRAGSEAGALRDILQRLDASGVLIPPEAAESFRKMRVEIEATVRAQNRLNQAWDSSIFAQFGADVTSGLESLKAAFLNFVASVLESFNHFVAALPAAVDLTMSQVKEIWFAGWAAMAQAVASFFGAIGLTTLAAQLSAMAEGWRQAAATAAQSSEEAAQRIREAWDQSLKKTEESAKGTGKVIAETFAETAQAAEASAGPLQQQVERWNAITNAVNTAVSALGTLSSTIEGLSWDNIMSAGVSAWDAFKTAALNALDRIIAKVLQLLGLQSKLGIVGGGGERPSGIGHNASGGLIGGRGTGTSDSNLAWVSRGEHIMPARAVRQPGMLALLEALRRSGGNLSRVLDGMGRFALGGMAMPRAIPAFAGGGLNRGGSGAASRVLNLTIDGRSFSGLSVPESTAQALERFAVHSQIASTGKKPSWKR